MTNERLNQTGYVYFIEMPRPCLIKVGFASNIDDRLANLRTASPFDLRLHHWFLGTKADEKRIQAELAPHRYRREWFRPDIAIENLIDDIYEYQVNVVADGPLGERTDLGETPILEAISEVPIGGYWEWRNLATGKAR